MLSKTRGVVLHTIRYGETSVICKIFTEKFGLQSYIINGVRSSKAKGKAAYFNAGALLDLDLYQRDDKNIQRIKEYKFSMIYTRIPFDMIRSSICMFLIELLNHTIKEHEANEDLFLFIYDQLCYLDSERNPDPKFHTWFMLQLAKYAGFPPGGQYSESQDCFDLDEGLFRSGYAGEKHLVMPPLSRHIEELYACTRDELNRIVLNKHQREELLRVLEEYFSIHLEDFIPLRSPKILKEVLD